MVRRPGRWENTAVLSLGDITYDPESGRLEGNGKECTLSKREGALLELMLAKCRPDTSKRGDPEPCLGSRQ